MNNQWLEQLKPGDPVVVSSSRSRKYLTKIDRITKTPLVIKRKNFVGEYYEVKFRRSDGFAPGDSWPRERLLEPTPELFEEIRREKLYATAGSLINSIKIPQETERVQQLIDVLKEYQ